MKGSAFHLILIVVAGVIVADLVAHAAGTSALAGGFNTLFTIATQPTNTGAIKVTPTVNNGSRKV
jgi:antitoxin (DNA-binding transcriptional repressor) of toxin-antitoxin stability system